MAVSTWTMIGFIALFLFAIYVALSVGWPRLGVSLRAAFRKAAKRDLRRYSPKRTIFLFGPDEDHAACRLQRRLLKPALAALIREDVAVIEAYGAEPPRRNGVVMRWLDADVLRHGYDVADGFKVVYVNDRGRVAYASDAPVVGADLVKRAGLDGSAFAPPRQARRSPTLHRLRSA
ncbi:MAG: hypothetical protein AAGC56_05190 [Pseudomonadota bacterium]